MFVLWNKVIVERGATEGKITKVRCEWTKVSLEDPQERLLGRANAFTTPHRNIGDAPDLPCLAITSWADLTLAQRWQSSSTSHPGRLDPAV